MEPQVVEVGVERPLELAERLVEIVALAEEEPVEFRQLLRRLGGLHLVRDDGYETLALLGGVGHLGPADLRAHGSRATKVSADSIAR